MPISPKGSNWFCFSIKALGLRSNKKPLCLLKTCMCTFKIMHEATSTSYGWEKMLGDVGLKVQDMYVRVIIHFSLGVGREVGVVIYISLRGKTFILRSKVNGLSSCDVRLFLSNISFTNEF